ncbi:hypothetical protein A9Q87_04470 [Flavobacteriales bacterium 34_180_T64]|nr:hypothetical protein A9Q87_04470 [Flavobacteriales bacterium 34_180_T64]
MAKFLFKHIDNSALIVFRIIFGLLVFLESVGAVFTGWIKHTLIDPEFTFTFIGFEWLQPLPGNWMYAYYIIMGLFGIFIMLGYKYRWSMIAFTLMWASTYFMQKSSYNNHYYLLMILSGIMIILPANTNVSIDVKQHPEIKRDAMPQWCKWILIIQMLIVYTFGSIAKLYPDWINTSVIELMMAAKQHYFFVGDLLQHKWMHYILAYGGILFDGLIIPLLLIKKTRKFAFIASICFHLFNSFVFQVGIFPYLSLAFALFFFEPKTIQKLFLPRKNFYKSEEFMVPKYKTPILVGLIIYFCIQIALPLRQHFIEDNVLWTEEGHRLSWRMMLRSKKGYAVYTVVDKKSEIVIPIKLSDYLTKKQQRGATTKPDVIWQFAQHLKKAYSKKGMDVKVFVDCYVSVNGRSNQRLINPKVDLGNIEWNAFKHSAWILPSKLD